MSVAVDLWSRYGQLAAEALPDQVRTFAMHSVLDWFGCAVAGRSEPVSRLLADEYDDANGGATLLCDGRRLSPQQAALVNGVAGHALDYDDSNPAARFHATAPILPAVLAIAEDEHRTGLDVLAALTVGVEVGGRFSALIGEGHYSRGWHSTATMGMLGATAAVSWLYRLGSRQFGHALGLAASQVGGVRANFGTMAKPFHAGRAAEGGLLAARLARRGVTANPEAFEGPCGLVDLVGDGKLNRDRLAAYGREWLVTKTAFKYHAACHGTHAPIEAALQLASGIDVDGIDRLRVQVHPDVLTACRIEFPASGLEAKFSIRGAIAMALLGIDTSNPDSFGDDWAPSSALDAVMHRIDVGTLPRDRPVTEALVELETSTGSRAACADVARYSGGVEVQEARLQRKFLALATPCLGGASAAKLAKILLGIADSGDVAELMAQFADVSNS